MIRTAFAIEIVSDEALARYREAHAAVPEEIAGPEGALAVIGLRAMSIHLLPPRTLFMQVEAEPGFDPERDFTRALALHPVVQQWDDLMHGELLRRLPQNNTALNWYRLEPIFDWTRDEEPPGSLAPGDAPSGRNAA